MSHGTDTARRAVAVLAVASLLTSTGACDDPTTVDLPLLRTAQAGYDLEVDAFQNLLGQVNYTFTNRTGAPVYIVNCAGQFDLWLERWDGDEWVPAWSAVVPQCLSPPIVIDVGQVFADTLSVVSGCPPSALYPELNCDDPDGTYRIAWVDALSSYQDRLPFGPQIPLEYRVSNAFELTRR